MISSLMRKFKRFSTEEDGVVTVPFAFWLPVFLFIVISAIELGAVTIRHTFLDSALDKTVREVKLGIGPTTHAQMKAAICERATILPNCEAGLYLEMRPLDMRDYDRPSETTVCVDTAEDVKAQRQFTNGKGGEVMFLRACYKFKPLVLFTSFNLALEQRFPDGSVPLISTSAFVNEPS